MIRNVFFFAAWTHLSLSAIADAPAQAALPPDGFRGDRYETLWTQSPFAIATPEVTASADYQLVGLAQFDGVSYASLVVKQTQEHFVLTSQKPFRGLTLISVSRSAQGGSALIDHAGSRLALQEEAAPAATVAPAAMTQPIQSTPAQIVPNNPYPFGLPDALRKQHARYHRPPVIVNSPPN